MSKILKIARKLYNQIYLPFHDIKKSITNLSYLYYKDQINSIEETCNQLKSIYDECDNILKNEPLLVQRLSFPDSIMIFLLLPWVIDDDSDEARRIEEYFKDTMKKVLESDKYVKYKETEDTDDFSYFLKGDYEIVNFVDDDKFVDVFKFLFWRKYFIEKVFPAEKELDPKKMKSHMKKNIKRIKFELIQLFKDDQAYH